MQVGGARSSVATAFGIDIASSSDGQ